MIDTDGIAAVFKAYMRPASAHEARDTVDAVIAALEAAETYYAFTMKPEPPGFNNAYNQEAIRVGAAMNDALAALPQQASSRREGDDEMPETTCPREGFTAEDGTHFEGCGSTNVSTPDDEGLHDCLDCGLWFTAASS
jgi:hypothetical protein